jgi:hypothetical protein
MTSQASVETDASWVNHRWPERELVEWPATVSVFVKSPIYALVNGQPYQEDAQNAETQPAEQQNVGRGSLVCGSIHYGEIEIRSA